MKLMQQELVQARGQNEEQAAAYAEATAAAMAQQGQVQAPTKAPTSKEPFLKNGRYNPASIFSWFTSPQEQTQVPDTRGIFPGDERLSSQGKKRS